MRTRFEVLTTSLLSLVISFNLLLYSLQRYSPPEADSPSFSVLYCTSHDVEGVSAIVRLVTDDEGKSGTEKHCFCHSCCSSAFKSEISKPATAPAACGDESRYPAENESTVSVDFKNGIPIRSPPASLI